MPLYNKITDIWKEITDIWIKISGTWKKIESGHVKVSGVWKEFYSAVGIPENLIAFFENTPASPWKVLNGVDASPDLTTNQVYLRGGSAEGSEAGSHTHTHNSSSFNLANNSNQQISSQIPKDAPCSSMNIHNHTANHGHTTPVDHQPLYRKMIPACGGLVIPIGGVVFVEGSVPSDFSAYTELYNRFLKCSSNGGINGGAASHLHSYTGYSGYTNPGSLPSVSGTYNAAIANHRHTINHNHAGGNNYPIWYGLISIRADKDIKDIPSGVCCFFKGNEVPEGWTQYSARDNDFIQGKSSSGGSGGANTHIHNHNGMSSGATNTGGCTNTSGVSGYTPYNHTHNWPSGNHASANNIPLHRALLFCKKD